MVKSTRCKSRPITWVERQLDANGFKVLGSERLPILYSEQAIRRQLNVAKSKLRFFADRGLAKQMEASIATLDARMAATVNSQSGRRIRSGFDYVIAAEIDKSK